MSTSSVSQEDLSSTNSLSSPDSNAWSPVHEEDLFLHPISPTLPLTKASALQRILPVKSVVTNRKERRRTQNINTAFADLRGCIPNVPQDTKLSKIKTLRLAISYIQHLMQQLDDERYSMVMTEGGRFANFNYCQYIRTGRLEKQILPKRGIKRENPETKEQPVRKRGRTGWPEMVWALELNR
ncbi:heart- and neural crest derivatives-expressed protein 1-like [Rhopilema esculentum]|uniref:heart- and neural crest derivatives-expressed protein 1-like n=1 Tax=Rhopilema esculentum TaxID=499914 RepID=UPI0031D6840A